MNRKYINELTVKIPFDEMLDSLRSIETWIERAEFKRFAQKKYTTVELDEIRRKNVLTIRDAREFIRDNFKPIKMKART